MSGPSTRRGAGTASGMWASRQARWKGVNTREALARGPRQLLGLGHQVGGHGPHPHAGLRQRRRHPRVAGARKGGDVAGEVDGAGAGLRGDLGDDPLRRAVAHHQAAAARAQRVVEGLEAGAQEAQPRRRAVVAAAQQRRVEDEQADDGAGVGRRAQGRMIGHPQVAPEPDQRRGAGAHALSSSRVRRWRSTKAASSRRPTSGPARAPNRPPRRR